MSRILWILAVLLSHWRRHPMQLATLLIGLISATALWSGVQALNQQARDSYQRAAAIFGGARTAMLVGRNGAAFPQQLFVDLRRAGWPVSPVLEGRLQIGGRSFRLLGIEPVTLPAEVGNAPAIGRAGLQSFLTPPGETLVAPEVLSDLNLPEGACRSQAAAHICHRWARRRNWHLVCWWSISVSHNGSSTCRIRFPGFWLAKQKSGARRSKTSSATNFIWCNRTRRAISNGSPTVFTST
jgi:hypothetical protein